MANIFKTKEFEALKSLTIDKSKSLTDLRSDIIKELMKIFVGFKKDAETTKGRIKNLFFTSGGGLKKKRQRKNFLTRIFYLTEINDEGKIELLTQRLKKKKGLSNVIDAINTMPQLLQEIKEIKEEIETKAEQVKSSQEKKKKIKKIKKREEKRERQAKRKQKAEGKEKEEEKESKKKAEEIKLAEARLLVAEADRDEELRIVEAKEKELQELRREGNEAQARELNEEREEVIKEENEGLDDGLEEIEQEAETQKELGVSNVISVDNNNRNVVVVDEADFPEQLIDELFQEQQNKEQINDNVEEDFDIEIQLDNARNEVEIERPKDIEQKEPIKNTGDELEDNIETNIVVAVAEEEKGNPENKTLEQQFSDELSDSVVLKNLKVIDDILDQIFQLKNLKDEDIRPFARSIAQMMLLLGNQFSEVKGQKQRNSLVKKIKNRRNTKKGVRIFNLVSQESLDIQRSVIEEERIIIRSRTEKTDKLLKLLKKQVTSDNLSHRRNLNQASPKSPQDILINDSIKEITDIISSENEIDDSIYSKIISVLKIVSNDTREVVIETLRNDITVVLNPSTIAGPLLTRFLGRLIWFGQNFSSEEEQQRLQAFYENREFTQQDRNEGLVQRILNDLREIIPRPPQPKGRQIRRPSQIIRRKRLLTMSKTRRRNIRRKRNRKLKKQVEKVQKFSFSTALNNFVDNIDDEINRLIKSDEDILDDGGPLAAEEEGREPTQEENNEMAQIIRNALAATATLGTGALSSVKSFSSGVQSNIAQLSEFEVNNLRSVMSGDRLENIIANVFVGGGGGGVVGGMGGIPMTFLIPILATVTMGALLGAALLFREGEPQVPERLRDVEERTGIIGLEDVEGELQRPQQLPSSSWLRPEFNMLGVDFFDNQFSRKNITQENYEWSDFNFVPELDRTNKIEIENNLSNDIRFREPLFLPKFKKPVAPPSKRSQILTRSIMSPVIQLDQSFDNKFSSAVNLTDNLSEVVSSNPFDRSWRQNALYHPDGSIM